MEELVKPDPIEAALAACVRCGACMQVCPVYREGRREELVARGKLALLKAVGQGGLAADSRLAELLSRCLLCGRCNANCPSQAPAKEAFRTARARLAQAVGAPSLEKLVIERALAHPRRLDLLAKAAGAARPVLPALSGLRLRLPGLQMAAQMPPLAQRPFHLRAPRRVAGPAGAPRLGLFVGCLANYLQPELAERALALLCLAAEVVVLPQSCCGLPAVSAGLEDAARQLARANLDHWRAAGVDKLVTFCGSCAYVLAKELPRLLDGNPAARRLAASVLDISQVLAERPRRLAGLGRTDAGPVAVHDPCHLKLDLGVWREPRAMLAAAGVELVDMAGADACCGGGGLFGLRHPELSQGIFAPRRQALAASGAATLATGCSGCYLQWRMGLAPDLRVAHPIELLDPARA